MLVDAFLEAKAKGTDMLKETYTKVKNYVKATKCEDMFNPDVSTMDICRNISIDLVLIKLKEINKQKNILCFIK